VLYEVLGLGLAGAVEVYFLLVFVFAEYKDL
jgi:hypothetical protein